MRFWLMRRFPSWSVDVEDGGNVQGGAFDRPNWQDINEAWWSSFIEVSGAALAGTALGLLLNSCRAMLKPRIIDVQSVAVHARS
jgi:hypothetical protein